MATEFLKAARVEPEEKAAAPLRYEQVPMIDPDGNPGVVPGDRVQEFLEAGYRIEAPERTLQRYFKQEYDRPGAAVALGFARGVSLGGSDALLRAAGMPAEELEQIRAQSPVLSGVGEVVGAAAPALLSGGTGAAAGVARLTPAGLAARAGTAASGVVEGAGALAGVGRMALGGAVEGGIAGAGSGVSALSMSGDPVTPEKIISTVGSHALFGAALGGAAGGGLGILGESAKAAKRGYDALRGRTADAAVDAVKPAMEVGDELTSMLAQRPPKGTSATAKATIKRDIASTVAEREAELAALKAAREAEEAAVSASPQLRTEGIKRFTDELEQLDSNTRQITRWAEKDIAKGVAGPEAAEALAALRAARAKAQQHFPSEALEQLTEKGTVAKGKAKAFALALDDDGLVAAVRKPEAMAALAEQREAGRALFRTLKPDGTPRNVGVGIEDAIAGITKSVDLDSRAAKLAEPLTSAKLEGLTAKLDQLEGLMKKGPDQLPQWQADFVKAAEAKGLSASLDDLAAAAKSEGLPAESAIGASKDLDTLLKAKAYERAIREAEKAKKAAAAGAAKETGEGSGGTLLGVAGGMAVDYMLDGALGWAGGMIGGGLAGRFLKGGLGKVLGRFRGAADGVSKRIGDGLDAFVSGTRQAAKRVPAATAMLGAASFDDSEPEEKPTTTSGAFKLRSKEIARAVSDMPRTRQKVADRLAGVRALDPIAADRMESLAVRWLSHLHQTMPKDPGGIGSPFGPSKWEPSDSELSAWARRVAAAEDPVGRLVGEMEDGTLSPETVDTVRAVYPELYQHIRTQLFDRLTELQRDLPYEKRLLLGVLFDAPVDGSLQPESMATLQASYQPQEPGGGQGEPRLGSVKAPEPTQAQRLAGGG